MSITLNITINVKVLIAIIFIIIIAFILIYKKQENFLVGNEAVANIARIYSDASGTAIFNNIKSNQITSNQIRADRIDISGKIMGTSNSGMDISANNISANNISANNISTNGTLNGYNLTMQGVDMRYYLTGVTLYNLDPDLAVAKSRFNSLHKIDLHLGVYSTDLGDGGTWGEIVDVAVIYPGFGADFWTDQISGSTCTIDNYGIKPLRIKLGSPPTVLAGGSSEQSLYNIDSNTYEITGAGVNRNELSSLVVRLVSDENKWRKHKIN
jgi:hypothetical protein